MPVLSRQAERMELIPAVSARPSLRGLLAAGAGVGLVFGLFLAGVREALRRA